MRWRDTRRPMLYAAKCYWPGFTVSELKRTAATRLSQQPTGGAARYVGSLVFASDELVLCLYEAASRAAVTDAARRARIPCERIIDSAWLPAAGSPLSALREVP